MAGVVIVGGGIGGLSTALLLGREGREVTVCERDPRPPPQAPDDMWSSWERPGTPQARLGHSFLAGFCSILRERAPDVLDRLLAAGAPRYDVAREMPGAERRPEDADLWLLMCRRPVLEGILRQAAEAEPTVELRAGCEVAGLTAEPSSLPGVPRVTGVRTRDGGRVDGTTVVIAGGRLAPVGRWLAEAGAQAPEELSAGCGLVCFTRYYRVERRTGEDHRVSADLMIELDLGFMRYELVGADRGTFCVELIPPAWDHDLRGLRDADVHITAARMVPGCAEWLDPGRAIPISGIAAMGGERNTLRRFVRDGRPVALGVHVIGDARCQTNSLYAWGSCNALAAAVAVVDVLGEHAGDPEAQALDLEARLGDELAGRYAYAVARDMALHRAYRGESEWARADPVREHVLRTVVPTAEADADVFRAVMRWELQLDPANALDHVTARPAHDRAPDPGQAAMPTRDEFLDLIAARA